MGIAGQLESNVGWFGPCGVIKVNRVFDCGFVSSLGPLQSPYWVLLVVMSGSPFTPIQAQV